MVISSFNTRSILLVVEYLAGDLGWYVALCRGRTMLEVSSIWCLFLVICPCWPPNMSSSCSNFLKKFRSVSFMSVGNRHCFSPIVIKAVNFISLERVVLWKLLEMFNYMLVLYNIYGTGKGSSQRIQKSFIDFIMDNFNGQK